MTQRPDRPLVVGVAQLDSAVGDVTGNIARAVDVVTRASDAGAALVVLPELSLTGYDLAALADATLWFTPDDGRLDRLRALSADRGVWTVVGAPVDTGAAHHLASVVLAPDGSTVVAPKTHLHGEEVRWFDPGAGPTTLDVDGWCVALAVCADTAAPEHAAAARAAGADVYATSVLYTQGEESLLAGRMAARARDHAMTVVAANTAGRPLGQRSAGGSGVWAPDGSAVRTAVGRDDELLVVPVP
ncbi:carbon-nitrogen hydrolase family protein [Cellulomonas sp. SLBN-39]|uniref:carbon-nitrogen hydrolase family protein n=1 Tax=Cellulomonas sp. SLBN-39 TaxID=2768446 RepID=UPI00114ED63D|nr:carbon-nitrogen hydrolase family protein [Cellulomonas sp. SLBN-39]TQL02360.1 putative amidohydrolase [Cellulomonas sp. SLBN-39]